MKQNETEILLNSILQVLTQLIANSYLNAFYSALLLKKQSGFEITLETEKLVLEEVFSKGFVIQKQVVKGWLKGTGQTEPFRPI